MSNIVNTTEEGISLLAQATAANPIVYTGAVGVTTIYQYKSQLRIIKKSTFGNEAEGDIFSCSATNDTVRVSALFRRSKTTSAKLIHTVLICGKLQNQSDSQAVGVLAWASTTGFNVVASNVSPDTGTIIPVNLSLSDADEVTVQAGDTPSIGDLDRFVSCYKAGNINEGDDQTIRGDKSFYDTCSFSDAYFSGDFIADTDILFNDEYNIGNEDQPVGTLYSNHIGTASRHVEDVYADSLNGVIPSTTTSDDIPVGAITCLKWSSSSTTLDIGAEISGADSLYVCSLDGNYTSSKHITSSMRVRLLTPKTANCPYALVIRIS